MHSRQLNSILAQDEASKMVEQKLITYNLAIAHSHKKSHDRSGKHVPVSVENGDLDSIEHRASFRCKCRFCVVEDRSSLVGLFVFLSQADAAYRYWTLRVSIYDSPRKKGTWACIKASARCGRSYRFLLEYPDVSGPSRCGFTWLLTRKYRIR